MNWEILFTTNPIYGQVPADHVIAVASYGPSPHVLGSMPLADLVSALPADLHAAFVDAIDQRAQTMEAAERDAELELERRRETHGHVKKMRATIAAKSKESK